MSSYCSIYSVSLYYCFSFKKQFLKYMKEIESESNTKFASVKRRGLQQLAHCCESVGFPCGRGSHQPAAPLTPGQVLEGAERLTWVPALPPRSPSVLTSPRLDVHCPIL